MLVPLIISIPTSIDALMKRGKKFALVGGAKRQFVQGLTGM